MTRKAEALVKKLEETKIQIVSLVDEIHKTGGSPELQSALEAALNLLAHLKEEWESLRK